MIVLRPLSSALPIVRSPVVLSSGGPDSPSPWSRGLVVLFPPSSVLRPPTSVLRPPSSDLRPPTSDLRPLSSDLRPPKFRRCLRGLIVVLLASALSLPWTHPWLLTSIAEAWIVDDAPAYVDAVIVLAGNADERPFHAAALYKAKRTPLILVSNVEPDRAARLAIRPSDTAVADAVLAHESIPLTSIDHFSKDVTSTRDEAIGFRAWLTRRDHETTDHETTDHETTDHETTDHETTDHETTDHQTTDHQTTDRETTDHQTTDHQTTDHQTTDRETTDHETTDHSTMGSRSLVVRGPVVSPSGPVVPLTVAIATDPFHTRRARWIFRRNLKGLPVAIHATAVPLKYSASDWWKHEEGLIDFQNEIIKSLYYWFKY